MTTLYNDNVNLYDIAFDWDVSDEVDWLLVRLGKDCLTVLEPGCGSGRMLEPIARRGIEVVGLDSSPTGVAMARKRLAGLSNASATVGDMVSFDLGRVFDGAICPINTLSHLRSDEVQQHFQCMSRHLVPGGRYLVQVAVRDPKKPEDAENVFEWEASRGDTRLLISVTVDKFDPLKSRELHRFRVEVVAGERAGDVVEEIHWMSTWSAESWQAMINASPFSQVGQHDGDLVERPKVEIGQTGNLMWHELVRS